MSLILYKGQNIFEVFCPLKIDLTLGLSYVRCYRRSILKLPELN